MSSKVIYTCDINGCGHVSNRDDLISVSIEIKSYSKDYSFRGASKYTSISMCPKCAEKLGITKQVLAAGKEETVNQVVTTSEQLYDIVCKIVLENINNIQQ